MKKDYHTNAIHVDKLELNIKDLKRSIDFYTNHLGFSVLKQTDAFTSLTVDGNREIIRLYEVKNGIPIDPKLGIYHFAILLPTRKDLSRFLKHLIDKQIPISGAADHLISEAIYLQDPDGIGIEIACDREQIYWDTDKLSVPMDTMSFDYPGVYYEDKENLVYNHLPKDTIIGHLHLQVKDLDESCSFYHDFIGFEVTSKDFCSSVFMSDAKYHHHLALNTINEKRGTIMEKSEIGLRTFTIQYPICESLIHTLETLKEHQISVEETLDGYFIQDCDYHKIYLEITHDRL